jgi:hypothetical protein
MSNGDLAYLLVNTSPNSAPVTLKTGESHTSASLLELSASSRTARDGITLGGKAVSPDGTWTPADRPRVSTDSLGTLRVSIASDSAVLVAVTRSTADSPKPVSAPPQPLPLTTPTPAAWQRPETRAKPKRTSSSTKSKHHHVRKVKPVHKAKKHAKRHCKIRVSKHARTTRCVPRRRRAARHPARHK